MPPQSVNVSVNVLPSFSPRHFAVVLQHLLKYLLFQRNQIPCVFTLLEQLLKVASTEDAKPVKELCAQADSLLTLIEKSLEQHGTAISVWAFVLGPTLVSPKEVFVVQISYRDQQHAKLQLSSAELDQIARNFVLQVAMQTSQLDFPTIGSTRLRLLALAPRTTGLVGFVPKQTFNLKKLRAFAVHISNLSSPTLAVEDNADCVWFEANTFISGLSK